MNENHGAHVSFWNGYRKRGQKLFIDIPIVLEVSYHYNRAWIGAQAFSPIYVHDMRFLYLISAMFGETSPVYKDGIKVWNS
jgi:hypothetical protein